MPHVIVVMVSWVQRCPLVTDDCPSWARHCPFVANDRPSCPVGDLFLIWWLPKKAAEFTLTLKAVSSKV